MQATRALDTATIVVERNRAHMGEQKEAVVVGALGVIGRYIVERLLRQDDWSVIGLSRRAAAAAKLAGLTEATHVFYAAFQPAAGAAAGYASNIAPNRDMLVNAVTAIDTASCWSPAQNTMAHTSGHSKHRHERVTRATWVPTIISSRSTGSPPSSAASAGTGWSCGRRPYAALRRARR